MKDTCPKAVSTMAVASMRAAEEDVYQPIRVSHWPLTRLLVLWGAFAVGMWVAG